MDENLLIQKSQAGDIKSFEMLIETYQKKAFNIAYRMLGNLEDANDVTQEAFVKVYKSLGKFKGDSKFSTWLYSIVTNASIDYMRKNRKTDVVYLDKKEEDKMKIEVPDNINTPEHLFEKKEIKRVIHDSINKLSKEHRTVIILRDIQGFSYDEIANILNCSEGTVKSRISRARGQLKNILSQNVASTTC
ncbi:RNA polymerase RpoE-like sigma-24 subunit [Serpentinicella alkaliphila]|uniref:RNA polymerase RpoE-like sigma-24 subunit n=1 Tax=Serpentinicella alkaliphila TaxID=1734049 RepID=A0A4R2TVZ4_9FIRM|nr:RNA polymerase RpoE-like sigma-24 subunit [Serpentinicella alkaliphila]